MHNSFNHEDQSIEPIDYFLGQKLNDYRNKRGWTLADLAEKVGVSHQQIHKYEKGITKISANTLLKFSYLFNTTPDSFYEGFDIKKYIQQNDENDDVISFPKKRKLNILLIEDNAADEFLARKALKESEFDPNIYCLHEGQEVLEFLRNKHAMTPFPRPDIILLDLNLPNVDGHSLLRSIKQDRDLQNIPVLVITNSLSKKDMENSYKNHASGYMTKSINYETFQKNFLTAIRYWTETVVLPERN